METKNKFYIVIFDVTTNREYTRTFANAIEASNFRWKVSLKTVDYYGGTLILKDTNIKYNPKPSRKNKNTYREYVKHDFRDNDIYMTYKKKKAVAHMDKEVYDYNHTEDDKEYSMKEFYKMYANRKEVI